MEKHRRMFMKRYAKIFVSCLLTFTMVFTSVQWSAIVNETTVVGAAETVPKEKKEVVEEENTKDSTTFQMEDGKKQTVFYGQDVRFEDENGDLQEYDPSLVRVTESKSEQGEDLKDYQYENKEGDKKHYLPKDLSEKTPVLMENGKYQISFAPIYGQETKKHFSGWIFRKRNRRRYGRRPDIGQRAGPTGDRKSSCGRCTGREGRKASESLL